MSGVGTKTGSSKHCTEEEREQYLSGKALEVGDRRENDMALRSSELFLPLWLATRLGANQKAAFPPFLFPRWLLHASRRARLV